MPISTITIANDVNFADPLLADPGIQSDINELGDYRDMLAWRDEVEVADIPESDEMLGAFEDWLAAWEEGHDFATLQALMNAPELPEVNVEEPAQ